MVNAVLAVKRSPLPFLDGERVGLLGRSMGGGVTYNTLVTQPGLVDAAVVDRHGAPEDSQEFWREVSPRAYFDSITEPLLIHHGTSDDSCPIRWTRATYDALQREGKDAKLFVYDGEEHASGPSGRCRCAAQRGSSIVTSVPEVPVKASRAPR